MRRLCSFILFILVLSACSSDHRALVDKADLETGRQKPHLAKYIYLQVIQKHKAKDNVRYRALKGLAVVSMAQLQDYETAVKALGFLFDEYSGNSRYETELHDLRLRASQIWRLNLERPKKALDVLSPLLEESNFSIGFAHELARVYMANNNFEQAEQWFVQTWEKTKQAKNCRLLKSIQLEIVQVYSLRDLCDDALKWANESFPETCKKDEFSIAIEKAHCFEISGEIIKARRLFEELIRDDPKNMRAHFFLEGLNRRQKEKQRK